MIRTSAIACLLLLLLISPPAKVQSSGGVEYNLATQVPQGFTQYTYPGDSITYNGTGMFVKGYSNTYGYISTQINDSVNYVETKLAQINGTAGVSWGPGLGLYWNNNTQVYFAAANMGYGGDLFVYSRINDIFSENYVHYTMNFNESIYLRIFIVNQQYLKFEFSSDAQVWIDFARNSQILQGNNTDLIDLTKQNIDPNNVTVMIGKGFLPYYNQFVTYDAPGHFSAYYNPDIGTIGTSYYDYLKLNNTDYVFPNLTDTTTSTTTTTVNNGTTTTTDTELIFQNNTVTVTETFNATNPALYSPFTPISIISGSVVLIVIAKYKKH